MRDCGHGRAKFSSPCPTNSTLCAARLSGLCVGLRSKLLLVSGLSEGGSAALPRELGSFSMPNGSKKIRNDLATETVKTARALQNHCFL